MSMPERHQAQWARDRFSAALEDELPETERRRFEAVLREDPEVAEEYARFQETLRALRSMGHTSLPPPPDLVAGVRERLRAHRRGRYHRRPLHGGLAPWISMAVLLAVLGLAAIAFVLWQAIGGTSP